MSGWGWGRQQHIENHAYDEVDNELSLDGEIGVTFKDSAHSYSLDFSDDEDLGEVQEQESREELVSVQEDTVDPLTQSEVYLAYNRPLQALEVLLEEYARPDRNKFMVAVRILKVYRKMGDTEARNESLSSFIVSLNSDIELFSNEDWAVLLSDLDILRKNEHLTALDQSNPSVRMTGLT